MKRIKKKKHVEYANEIFNEADFAFIIFCRQQQ